MKLIQNNRSKILSQVWRFSTKSAHWSAVSIEVSERPYLRLHVRIAISFYESFSLSLPSFSSNLSSTMGMNSWPSSSASFVSSTIALELSSSTRYSPKIHFSHLKCTKCELDQEFNMMEILAFTFIISNESRIVWGCFLEMPGERRAWRSVGYKEWAKADRMRKPKTLYQSELYLSSWNALITSHNNNTVTPFLASYPS